MIQRYSIARPSLHDCPTIVPNSSGDLCRWQDVDAHMLRMDALETHLKALLDRYPTDNEYLPWDPAQHYVR